jgi:N-acetylglucosaminyl-diphospho-decaprenol L-rhamnosyltransferase
VVAEAQVTAVIVNYNTRECLRRCLSSVIDVCAVVVVDNASADGSPQMVRTEFPNVRLIENSTNVGFGAANNQGIAIATTPFVLLLNSDAYASPDAITILARQLEQENVVAVGGRLVNPDGTLQESSANRLTLWAVLCEQLFLEKLLPQFRTFSPYWMSRRLLSEDHLAKPVHQVMGACLMFKPLETFDPRFFLYCEDTDLCERLHRHGSILYVPAAVFVHELGASSTRTRWRSVAMYNLGKELYFRIHTGPGASLACLLLDRFGAALRLMAWSFACLLTLGLKARFRNQVSTFARVLFAPTSYNRLKPKG